MDNTILVLMQGKQYNQILEQARGMAPEQCEVAEVATAIGKAYEKTGDFSSAGAWYKRGYHLTKEDEVLGMFMGVTLANGDYVEAEIVLDKVEEAERGFYYWAACYEIARKTDKSNDRQIATLEEFLDVQQEENYLLRLAMLYVEEGRDKEASKLCKKISRLFINGEAVDYAETLLEQIKAGNGREFISSVPWEKGNVFKYLSFSDKEIPARSEEKVVQSTENRELDEDKLSSRDKEILKEVLEDGAESESKNKEKLKEEKISKMVESCFEGVVSMKELKTAMNNLHNVLQFSKKRKGLGVDEDILGNSIVIAGPDGCGKTTAARVATKTFAKMGIVQSEIPQVTDYQSLVAATSDETFENIRQLFELAADGVIIIENVQEFDDANAYSLGLDAINQIVKAYDAAAGRVALIITGDEKGIQDLFMKKKRFRDIFRLEPIILGQYSLEDLVEISHCIAEKKAFMLDEKADAVLGKKIAQLIQQPDFRYSRDIEHILTEAYIRAAKRLANKRHLSLADSMLILEEDFVFEESDESIEELLAKLNRMTGLKEVKEQVNKIVNFMRVQKEAEERGLQSDDGHGTLHLVFKGNAGTGKTTVARIIGKIYKRLGVLSEGQLIEVSRSDLVADIVGGTAKQVTAKIKEAMGGILFIDEAYALCTDEYDTFGKEAINTLVAEIENHRDALMVIIAGYSDDMDKFLAKNQGLKSRFPKEIIFEDYTPEEMLQIFKKSVIDKGYILSAGMDEGVLTLLRQKSRQRDFGNARGVRNVVEAVILKQRDRLAGISPDERTDNDYIVLRRDDLELEEAAEKDKTVEEYLEELNSLIGLASVKEQVKSIVNSVKVQQIAQQRNLGNAGGFGTLHLVFKGNAGTGKTTVARIIGNIYRKLGVLSTGVFVECDKSSLVAGFQGQTAQKVKDKVKEAMGGILFIDEAYALSSGDGDTFGQEAIDTLVADIENYRSNLMVIIAGYSDQMDEFLSKNQGLGSRFPKSIVFEDYSLEEMVQIFKRYVKKEGLVLEEGSDNAILTLLKQRSVQKDFGNARGVRNVFEAVQNNQRNRLAQMSEGMLTDLELTMIRKVDFGVVCEENGGLKTIQDYLDELNALTGLASVKAQINSLVSTAEVNKKLREMGLATSDVGTLHMVFKGNAGTGKTTVARIIGNIYRELGFLSNGRLVECDRSSLVGSYVGHTAKNVKAKVKEAMGGILFIDEAYALCTDDKDSFGQEAINTLVADIENYRNNMMVIIAGYSGDMDKFLSRNQGLKSRFPNEIIFEDYTVEEMLSIFKGMLKKNQLVLDSDAEILLKEMLEHKSKGRDFGNARGVRNVFEAAVIQKNARLHRMIRENIEFSKETAQMILREDLEPLM
ncbi:MAG: AAA family ATPase [Lachnospiraceae bacterium]|nr:AAA family ATPase [Lachnospiraceae bacterium]